jgi:predicted RNase H-like nuclease (RuvC/YqgF family)
MSKPDIHQLEERVLALIEGFRRLKDENQELSRQVDQLNREKETLVKEQNLSQGTKDRLSQLESLGKKNEKDRKVMRTKVKTLLENLEKFDLA